MWVKASMGQGQNKSIPYLLIQLMPNWSPNNKFQTMCLNQLHQVAMRCNKSAADQTQPQKKLGFKNKGLM